MNNVRSTCIGCVIRITIIDLKTETKEYVCQVFYFKESINIWRTTLAFLPKYKLKVYHCVNFCNQLVIFWFEQEVKEHYYLFAENGPAVDVHLKSNAIKPSFGSAKGWVCDQLSSTQHQQV